MIVILFFCVYLLLVTPTEQSATVQLWLLRAAETTQVNSRPTLAPASVQPVKDSSVRIRSDVKQPIMVLSSVNTRALATALAAFGEYKVIADGCLLVEDGWEEAKISRRHYSVQRVDFSRVKNQGKEGLANTMQLLNKEQKTGVIVTHKELLHQWTGLKFRQGEARKFEVDLATLTFQEVGQKVQVWVIRHGQAEHNVHPRDGWKMHDPRLTTTGIEQAKAVGQKLKKQLDDFALISSPLKRTIQTALHAFPDHKIIVESCLQEDGEVPSDRGNPVSHLQTVFSKVDIDFSRLKPGWETEPKAVVLQNFADSLREVMEMLVRGNKVGVIVTHAGRINKWVGARFENGEARKYEVTLPSLSIQEIPPEDDTEL